MRKLLCLLNKHHWVWYTEFDKDLYWERSKESRSKLVTGPLLECRYCDAITRCQDTDGSKILEFKNKG